MLNCIPSAGPQFDATAHIQRRMIMSQSRAIRFAQIRLVTDCNRIETLNNTVRAPAVRAKPKHWVEPTAATTSIDIITLPEIKVSKEFKDPFDDDFLPHQPETKMSRPNKANTEGDGDWLEETHQRTHESAEGPPLLPSPLLVLDDADQKVSLISTMSLVRSIVADQGIRAIADSVARISNDEANDRNGPWYFEMHHATHLLPMTVLAIELSLGEILLRFISSDAASVRLICDRKEDLKAQLENRLSPPRSVQIEVIPE
jgi:Type III secretion protein (HpaP)